MKNIVKTILIITGVILLLGAVLVLGACSQNDIAQYNYEREQKSAQYQSDYARTVNKMEMSEGNFEAYRRVTFYNVRLGETVFVCEGYSHVQIDKDGDCEIVCKVGKDKYLRHYLGLAKDMIYFSEQLEPNEADSERYHIMWNPKLWIPIMSSDMGTK